MRPKAKLRVQGSKSAEKLAKPSSAVGFKRKARLAPSRGTRRSNRAVSPVKKFELIDNAPEVKDTPTKQPTVYSKGDQLAVLNEFGNYYVCQTLQNIYENSASFKLQWFNSKATTPDTYERDYNDSAAIETILTKVNLTRTGNKKFQLADSEKSRILKILKKSTQPRKRNVASSSDESETSDAESSKAKTKKRKAAASTLKTLEKASKVKSRARVNLKRKVDPDATTSALKSRKKEKPPKPEKLRGAKYPKNLSITILEKDPTFDSNENLPPISIIADSKECIRAVRTKNYKLLKKCIDNVERVASVGMKQSVNCDNNAYKEALLREDLEALKILFKYDRTPFAEIKSRVSIPHSNLPTGTGTGTMNYKMLGHATAPISSARGSREGNKALNKLESTSSYNLSELRIMALEHGLSQNTIFFVSKFGDESKTLDHSYLCENVYLAIRNGHCHIAKKIMDEAVARGGYGFSELFSKALDNKPSFGNIRPSSVVKKSYSNRKITPLHCAAINPNVGVLSKLIAINSDFNIMDYERFKIIHYAAACKNSKTTEFLVNRGVSIDDVTKYGETPLHIACKLGRSENVECLLQKSLENDQSMKDSLGGSDRKDVESKTQKKFYITASEKYEKTGFNPIQLAAKNGHKEAVQALLKFDINIEKKTRPNQECMSALTLAAAQGHLPVVKALVEGGAKLENSDRRKKSALIHAVMNGHTHVASYLLHEGANPNAADSSGNTVIHYAVAYGWWKCLLLLLEAGAEATRLNDWKLPPLAVALLKNQEGIVSFLLNRPEIEVNFKDNDGKTLLMQFMQSVPSGELIKQMRFFIVNKKADAAAIDVTNNNALHYLASTRYCDEKYHNDLTKAAKLLIDHGCNPEQLNDNKYTPFHIAISNKCKPLMDLFMDMNILDKICSISDKDKNLLHFFISSYQPTAYYLKIFKKFVSFTLAVKENTDSSKSSVVNMCEIRNEKGQTPLLSFCEILTASQAESYSFHAEMLQILLDKLKCDPNAVEENKENSYNTLSSPLHILANARRGNTYYAIPILKKFKADPNIYNRDGRTPLMCAIITRVNFEAVFQKLVEAGADVNLPSKSASDDYSSPLVKLASVNVYYDVMDEMLKNGADVTATTRVTKKTALHFLVEGFRNDALLQIMRSVLNVDKSIINKKDEHGRTALHLAIGLYKGGTDSFTDVEELLLEYGADPLIQDDFGRLPLHYAFLSLQTSKHTASVTSKSYNDIDPIEMVSVLIGAMKGKSVNQGDNSGWTCLHCAALCGATVSCMFLCHRMKNINPKNDLGNTPLGIAVVNKKENFSLNMLHNNADVNVSVTTAQKKEDFQKSKSKYVHQLMLPTEKRGEDFERPVLQEIVGHNWQGVLYTALMMIEDSTKNYNDVIEAALVKVKYNLVLKLIRRTYNNKNLYEKRKHGRNFLHQLALTARDNNKDHENRLLIQVAKAFTKKGVSLTDVDEFQTMPIIYAAQNHNYTLCNLFATEMNLQKCRYAIKIDVLGRTIVSSTCMLSNSLYFKVDNNFGVWIRDIIRSGAPIDVLSSYPHMDVITAHSYPAIFPTRVDSYMPDSAELNGVRVSPLIYAIAARTKSFLKEFLELKPSLNFPCENGLTPLMYAVIVNQMDIVKLLLNKDHKSEYDTYLKKIRNKEIKPKTEGELLSIRRTVRKLNPQLPANIKFIDALTEEDRHFKMKSNVVFNICDKNQKTVLHHLLSHFKFGSYDNLRMLQFLMCNGLKFEFEDYFPYLENGSLKIKEFLETIFEETSSVSAKQNSRFEVKDKITFYNISTSSFNYSYKDDSVNALQAINPKYFEPEITVSPNSECECADNGEVVYDSSAQRYYSIKMQKMDIDYGVYGYYNFYVMQVVYDKAKGLYFLFTKWGRIGSEGQWQNTPFSTEEECIKEFKKIFKAKSGNDWNNVANFVKLPFKYRFLNTVPKKEVSISGMKICLAPPDGINSKLTLDIKKFLKTVSDVAMLQDGWRKYKIDSKSSPFGFLDRPNILEAELLLGKIRILQEEVTQLNTRLNKEESVIKVIASYRQKSYEIYKEIEEISEKVYELLPMHGYQDDDAMFGPIYTDTKLSEMTSMVEQLLDLDITSKLVLGAHYRIKEIHPMDYIYRSLQCKLEHLSPEDIFSSYILQYINETAKNVQVEAIFKVALKHQSELSLPNHRLLWHGTKLENVIGIFSQGLRVSPLNAQHTGQIFGKGIYFSDSFNKSQGYTDNWKDSFHVMLLCEVALGKSYIYTYNDDKGKSNFNSIIAQSGIPDPDYDVTLPSPYGAVIPLGAASRYASSEYIVPDNKQVCIRFMVLFK